jgi:hypothetical protein
VALVPRADILEAAEHEPLAGILDRDTGRERDDLVAFTSEALLVTLAGD